MATVVGSIVAYNHACQQLACMMSMFMTTSDLVLYERLVDLYLIVIVGDFTLLMPLAIIENPSVSILRCDRRVFVSITPCPPEVRDEKNPSRVDICFR